MGTTRECRASLRMFSTLVTLCLVAGMLVVAGGTAEANRKGAFEWAITSHTCSATGGDSDLGKMGVKGSIGEFGRSGTDYVQIIFVRQRLDGDAWTKVGTVRKTSAVFGDSRADNTFNAKVLHSFQVPDTMPGETVFYRFSLGFRWMNKVTGADKVLKSKTLVTKRCGLTFDELPPPPPPPPPPSVKGLRQADDRVAVSPAASATVLPTHVTPVPSCALRSITLNGVSMSGAYTNPGWVAFRPHFWVYENGGWQYTGSGDWEVFLAAADPDFTIQFPPLYTAPRGYWYVGFDWYWANGSVWTDYDFTFATEYTNFYSSGFHSSSWYCSTWA